MGIIISLFVIAALLTLAWPVVVYGLMALFAFWPFIAAYFILAGEVGAPVDPMEYWFLAIAMQVVWAYVLGMSGRKQKSDDDTDWEEFFRGD